MYVPGIFEIPRQPILWGFPEKYWLVFVLSFNGSRCKINWKVHRSWLLFLQFSDQCGDVTYLGLTVSEKIYFPRAAYLINPGFGHFCDIRVILFGTILLGETL